MITSSKKKYEATYISKDGKTSHLIIKFNPKRLAALGLIVFQIATLTGCKIGGEKNKNNDQNIIYEEIMSDLTSDKSLIDEMLLQHGDFLQTVTSQTHEMKAGDTISGIAEYAGCTINEICRLNDIENPSMVQLGTIIKYNKYEEKSEIDKEILILEMYLTGYLPLSEYASKYYKGEYDPGYKEQFEQILFRDGVGAIAMARSAYLKYHYKDENFIDLSELDDEEKKNYLGTLESIKDDFEIYNNTYDQNLGVPYDIFKIYCINGNTKSFEVKEKSNNIYN